MKPGALPPGHQPRSIKPNIGAPKLQVNVPMVFLGTPIDVEYWELSTSATLGKTVYEPLL